MLEENYVSPNADEDENKAFNICFFSFFLHHTLCKSNADWNRSADLRSAAAMSLWEHRAVSPTREKGFRWDLITGRSKSERTGISWRSSQQAPQWAGLAWRQSAHLLQAPAAFMCKHATYVWAALVFPQCAGVNPCKSDVSAAGSAAIRHSQDAAVCLQSPRAVSAVGCREGGPGELQVLPCFQPVFNKGTREHPAGAAGSCSHPLLLCVHPAQGREAAQDGNGNKVFCLLTYTLWNLGPSSYCFLLMC